MGVHEAKYGVARKRCSNNTIINVSWAWHPNVYNVAGQQIHFIQIICTIHNWRIKVLMYYLYFYFIKTLNGWIAFEAARIQKKSIVGIISTYITQWEQYSYFRFFLITFQIMKVFYNYTYMLHLQKLKFWWGHFRSWA